MFFPFIAIFCAFLPNKLLRTRWVHGFARGLALGWGERRERLKESKEMGGTKAVTGTKKAKKGLNPLGKPFPFT